jgi:hypothetical protein
MRNFSETTERRSKERFFVTGKPLAVMRTAQSQPGKQRRMTRDVAEVIYCSIEGSNELMTAEIDILVPDFTRGKNTCEHGLRPACARICCQGGGI